jgi:tetratricopeptide (TPR) repeat protein
MISTNAIREPESTRLGWSTALDRQALVLLVLALAVLTIALYLPALRNGFINFDDPDYVTGNAHVLRGLSWENFRWAFGTDNPAANWHPLTWLSHMSDVQAFGLNPLGHHLINILLMAVDVVLLFLFLAGTTGRLWRSAAVAALFAVHPLNVEAVAWVAERKQVLSLLFMFLALIAYAWYVRRRGLGRYFMVAVMFAFALMSKVMIITLPFAMLLLDYWPLERFSERSEPRETPSISGTLLALVKEKIPLFLLSAAAGWITLGIHRQEGTLSAVMPLTWRLKNVIYSYAVYLWKAVWPTKLAVFYPHPENRLPLWQVGIAAVVLLAISLFVWKNREKKYLAVGWLWYLGTAFPMIGLIQSGRQGMADRYEDLPLLGVFVAVVWMVADGFEGWNLSPQVAATGFAALLLPLMLLTHRQIGHWKDSETLFTHAVRVTSHNGLAENNLGTALMGKGDLAMALPHFVAAVQYAPDLGNAHYNLGVALHRQNQLSEAAIQYKLAIEHAGDAAEAAQAHNNLGVLYLGLNNLTVAKAELDQAIALNPDEVNSYTARGTIEFQSGKLDEAIADFSQANKRAASPLALYWLGRAEEAKGDLRSAKAAYQAALQMAPGMTVARTRLESLKTLTGQ